MREPYRLGVMPDLSSSCFCVVEVATGKVLARYDRRAIAQGAVTQRNRKAMRRQRPCMTCRTPFLSEGVHNRMCKHCRPRGGGTFDMPYAVGR